MDIFVCNLEFQNPSSLPDYERRIGLRTNLNHYTINGSISLLAYLWYANGCVSL